MPTAPQPPRKRQRMPDVVPASDEYEEADQRSPSTASRSFRGRKGSGAQSLAKPKVRLSNLSKPMSSTTSAAKTPSAASSSSKLTRPSSTVLSASRTRNATRPSSSSSVMSPSSSPTSTTEGHLQIGKRSQRKTQFGATNSNSEKRRNSDKSGILASTTRKPSTRQSTAVASLKPSAKPPSTMVSSNQRQPLRSPSLFFQGGSQDRYWSAGSFNSRAASVASHDDVFDAIEDDEDDEDEHQDPKARKTETEINEVNDIRYAAGDKIETRADSRNETADVDCVGDDFFDDDDNGDDDGPAIPRKKIKTEDRNNSGLQHAYGGRLESAGSAGNKPTGVNDVGASDDFFDEFFDDDENIYHEICSRQPKDDYQTVAESKKEDAKQRPKPRRNTDLRQRTNARPSLDNKHSAQSTPVPSSTAGSVKSNLAKRFFWPSAPGSTASTQSGSFATSTTNDMETSGRPWADQYPPLNLQELVVHKRKVTDVQNWLSSVFTGRNKQRILVLRGPAGSGKTSTVSLLSGVLGYDIVEWKQPLGVDHSNAMSMGAHFDDFLSRGDKFGTLETDINPSTSRDHRVLLIEEFPSFMSSSSVGLRSFRTSLQRYLATDHDGTTPGPPAVIVVSETMLGSASGPLDGFTVHKLLGPEIINHSALGIIDFNAIAPTFMLRALELVVRKDARVHQRKQVPNSVLKQFCDSGDVRSAISSLEFLCRQSPPTQKAASGRGKSATSSSSWEKETLQTITQRENSLGLFHAAGKVMYNKRDNPAEMPPLRTPLPPPPPHLSHHSRPFVSQVSVDDILNETGTDAATFLASLHENYASSCNSRASVAHLDDCSAYLSDSDALCSSSCGADNKPSGGGGGGGGGGRSLMHMGANASLDMLRQDEMAFHVGVRGLLFALPYPVRRQAQAHKLFYPTSIKLWRRTEEMAGMIEQWTLRCMDPDSSMGGGDGADGAGDSDGRERRKTRKAYGVEAWRSSRLDESRGEMGGNEDDNDDERLPSRTLASRGDVLLDRLPYLRHITTTSRSSNNNISSNPTTPVRPPRQLKLSSASINNLRLLTQFSKFGVGRSTQPEEDDLDLDADMSANEDNANSPFTPSQPLMESKSHIGDDESTAPEERVSNLVLEDDDIED